MFYCPGDQQGANRQNTTHKQASNDMSGRYYIDMHPISSIAHVELASRHAFLCKRQ